MNDNEIEIMEILCENKSIRKDILREKFSVGVWQFNSLLRRLRRKNFIKNDSLYVYLADNLKCNLLIKVSKKYDLKKLLRFSNESILPIVTNGISIDDLIKHSGVSRATVYRALADFEEVGIIKKSITVINDEDLKLFSRSLELLTVVQEIQSKPNVSQESN